MKYSVEFENIRHTTICVDAKSQDEAEKIAWGIMNDGETITNDDCGLEETIISHIENI